MKKRSLKPVFVIIMILGAFGFVYTIVEQPLELFQRIFFILLFIGIFYAIYKLLSKNHTGGKGHLSYMKAVKQSKKRNLKHQDKKASVKGVKKVTPLTRNRINIEKKKNEVHFTVIEGKKGKKKNRASF